MLSRVAESMYWMSRYIERAENTARFLDVNFHLLLDLSKITQMDVRAYWEPLIIATDEKKRFEATYGENYNADTVSEFLMFNKANPNSILSCVGLARENARSIIETISSEMWEQINSLFHFINHTPQDTVRRDPYNFYREIKNGSHLFQGITDATLPRSEGWDFVQVGKYLERADNTARILDVKYHLLVPQDGLEGYEVDIVQWMAVLKSCSALEAFRKVYQSKIEPRTVLQYLVLDGSFPRSIYFSIKATQAALWQISGNGRREYSNNADRLIGKLEAELGYTTVDDIYDYGLHNFLEELERKLIKIGDQIHQTYYAYQIPDIINDPRGDTLFYGDGRAIWSQAAQQQQ
jgi:uncharacterized alpha-E superfamily protein